MGDPQPHRGQGKEPVDLAEAEKYSYDLLLRAQDGVNPRSVLRHFQDCAERAVADWFIVGNSPISPHPFKIVDISDEWAAVVHGGVMVECKVTLTIEEYL